ncbi:MAG: hypothetical protein PSW75_12510 [bacterium]|nr:hypothetical protein [bacterium]MDI1335757.1 hypothetical protein [Lacunisphaera sp.]
MRHLLLAIFLLLTPSLLRADPVVVSTHFHQDREALEQLNRELWQPLRRAYAAADSDSFAFCFSGDAVIASGDMPSLNPGKDYLMAEDRRFLLRPRKPGFDLVPRFTERAVSRNLASERGFLEQTEADGTKIYSEFHAFSRRIDGRWRLIVLYRKTINGTGAAQFAAATALEELAKF